MIARHLPICVAAAMLGAGLLSAIRGAEAPPPAEARVRAGGIPGGNPARPEAPRGEARDRRTGNPEALATEDASAPPRRREDLCDEELCRILDKGKIAQEAYQRIVGLAESGHPNVPRGTVLEKAQIDPERAKVDPEALRNRLIALVESHGYDPTPLARPAAARAAQVRRRPAPGLRACETLQWIVAGLSAAVCAFAIWFLRRGRDAPAGRREAPARRASQGGGNGPAPGKRSLSRS